MAIVDLNPMTRIRFNPVPGSLFLKYDIVSNHLQEKTWVLLSVLHMMLKNNFREYLWRKVKKM